MERVPIHLMKTATFLMDNECYPRVPMRVARVVSEVGCDGGRARHASPRVHIVNIQSKNQARKLVREAQTRAYEERVQRERDNVDDLDTFLVARTRFAGVEEWQGGRGRQTGEGGGRRA